ncbi:MAG: hypothetical protein PHT92_05100 [Bacteroidales bacterium]|jgi:hypothetical protein|nr:hypothetical protein [Bacteroidales bacterium]
MRKLLLGVAMLLFAQMGFGQMVSDQAVIPVSVTLNSILRLTVTSGGNIVFVFNTIDQYENGIGGTPRTTTTFQVSSSRDYSITMVPENGTFIGLETGNTTFALNNVGYVLATTGGAVIDNDLHPLAATQVLTPGGGATAGGNHQYTIQWEVGTAGTGMAAALSTQSLATDIYVNNIFLTLAPE